nr:hypothetical protein [Gemmatimonadaceae bacterium]
MTLASRLPLVIKFGGTALASPSRVRRAVSTVQRLIDEGVAPIVVCSANGDATDRLLEWSAAVGGPHSRTDREPWLRERDRVLATGEDRSAALFALALTARGVGARSVRGAEAGLHAEGAFGAGRLFTVDPAPLQALHHAGIIPVVSGYHATRRDGETITLGRGASDLVA